MYKNIVVAYKNLQNRGISLMFSVPSVNLKINHVEQIASSILNGQIFVRFHDHLKYKNYEFAKGNKYGTKTGVKGAFTFC